MTIPLRMRMVSAMLVMVILTALVAPAFMPKRSEAFVDILLTVGAVLGIGKITEGLVGGAVDKVEGAAKDVMREAAAQISKLLKEIETTYGNALDTTLDSLDSFTGQQMAKLAALFDQVNQMLMEDVAVIKQAVIDLLQQANVMIQQTMTRLEDLIVVGVRGATFVIDKATYNLAFIIALVLLAIGLLAFTRLLWTGKVPGGWVRVVALGFMTFYVLLFSALLIPQTRVYAITMVGQADQLKEIGPGARIFTVTPGKVAKGATVDLMLVGVHFDAGGEPKVLVGGQEVAPKAWSDTQVAVQLTGALANLSGTQGVAVKTADGKQSSPALVEFVAPPAPPQVVNWRLVPSGQAYSYSQFGPFTATCDTTGKIADGFEHRFSVGTGWELAADDQHVGSIGGTPGNVPNPPRGFSERQVKSAPHTTVQMARVIEYLPSASATRKDGILVKGTCFRPPFGTAGGVWQAQYTLWGKKLGPKDGLPATGGVCTAAGIVKCGTYPASRLEEFRDGRPDRFNLNITIKTSTGQTVDRSAIFVPGSPTKLTVENVSVWMENNDLMVQGPGSSKPPLIIHPLPGIKPILPKLPIFKP